MILWPGVAIENRPSAYSSFGATQDFSGFGICVSVAAVACGGRVVFAGFIQMIHFVLGGFGSGKSYSGMRMIRAELLGGNRPVVTNLAVREKDLAEYFAKKFSKAHIRLHQRLRLLTDDEVPQFYLHRLSKAGLWYDIAPPDPDAEKRGARPDWTRWRDSGVLQEKRMIEEAIWTNPQVQGFVVNDEEPGLAVSLIDLVKTFRGRCNFYHPANFRN